MSWEYIAGFFDGEGYVGASLGRTTNAVGMCQQQLDILLRIQEFLQDNGIKSNIQKGGEGYTKKQVWSLRMAGTVEIRKFLPKVIPFLYVKRQKAEDQLRFWKVFPPSRHVKKTAIKFQRK